MKVILTIIGILILSSCNPRLIKLLEKDLDKIVPVYYLGKLHNVNKLNDNSISAKDSALISFKIFGVTNHIIEFNIKNKDNQYFRINLRNIFDKFNPENGIQILIKNNTYNIFERNELIKSGFLNIEDNYFYFENDGRYLKIKINCDDISIDDIGLFATEYMIVENFESSNIVFSGFNWENLQSSKKIE